MIVAGEASGDGHAAKLVRALREAEPETEFEFFGAAGPKMRAEGVDAVVQSDNLSIVGVAEIVLSLSMFLRAFKDLKDAASRERPDTVILVDFPDFNLKLAKALKKQGFTIIYYISPQLWAWRKYRISAIRKYVDLLLTILPFEKDWYAKRGVKHVEFVGNPLTNEVNPIQSKAEFCRVHNLDESKPIISLLPGSRQKEIVRILPVMLQTANHIMTLKPDVQFVIAVGSSINRVEVDCVIGKISYNSYIKIIQGETIDAINASDAAAVTSGTATLETGIVGTPMVIVYKTSALNYALLKPLISVEYYGLINLIAGEGVAKELIQDDFTVEKVSAELLRLLEPDVNAAIRKQLLNASGNLGPGGASQRAAKAVLAMLNLNKLSD